MGDQQEPVENRKGFNDKQALTNWWSVGLTRSLLGDIQKGTNKTQDQEIRSHADLHLSSTFE